MTQTPVSTHDSDQDPRNENILIYVDGALVPKQEAAERGLRLHTVPMIRGLPMTQDPKLNSHSKLNGITRRKVIELCRQNDIPVFERNYSLLDSYGAEEAFVTGTFGGLTPVRLEHLLIERVVLVQRLVLEEVLALLVEFEDLLLDLVAPGPLLLDIRPPLRGVHRLHLLGQLVLFDFLKVDVPVGDGIVSRTPL